MRASSGVALLALCYVLTGCGERSPEWIRVDSGTTHTLEAIHGTGPNDVWAVGQAGTILHFDGIKWSPVDSGTGENLKAVWTLGPKDAWAMGERVRLHWDGERWTRTTGSGGTDLSHWSCARFSAEPPRLPSSSRCWDLSGFDTGEVWALYYVDYDDYATDNELVVLRKEAEGWSQVPVDQDAAGMWQALWGTGGKVWIAGSGGLVDHFDGSVWNRELRWDYDAPDLRDIWGSSEKDIWVVGGEGLVARRAWPTSP